MNTEQSLHWLASFLKSNALDFSKKHFVVGFDGFVDEMISVVQERQNASSWTRVSDISAFNALIANAAGHSSLREIVINRTDAGGCAVNLADGLVELGVKVDCFATMGIPRHRVFDAISQKLHGSYSWGREYGRTLALEFSDGKLMYSAVSQLAEFNTDLLDSVLSDNVYLRACQKANVIAITDWTLYPHMTECWIKLQNEVYSKLSHRPYFFIDLVDPSSRSREDVLQMLRVLSEFEKYGETTLGLNGNEANVLSNLLKLNLTGTDIKAVQNQAASLRQKLGLSQILIHHRRFAITADAEGIHYGEAPFSDAPACVTPKKSTGAGDHFNSGYCMGLSLGLEPLQCLNLAAAVTGLFVRNGHSVNLEQVCCFIENWARGNPDDLLD